MPPGGSIFAEEKTCNCGKLWYNHDTTGWEVAPAPGAVLWSDPCFAPCWKLVRRFPTEEEIIAASADGAKTGRENLLKRVNGNSEKMNLKWSWMREWSKIDRKVNGFGWPVLWPHFWPMFWPIRDHHAVDWVDFSGFGELSNAANRRQSPDYPWEKLCKPQLITRRS